MWPPWRTVRSHTMKTVGLVKLNQFNSQSTINTHRLLSLSFRPSCSRPWCHFKAWTQWTRWTLTRCLSIRCPSTARCLHKNNQVSNSKKESQQERRSNWAFSPDFGLPAIWSSFVFSSRSMRKVSPLIGSIILKIIGMGLILWIRLERTSLIISGKIYLWKYSRKNKLTNWTPCVMSKTDSRKKVKRKSKRVRKQINRIPIQPIPQIYNHRSPSLFNRRKRWRRVTNNQKCSNFIWKLMSLLLLSLNLSKVLQEVLKVLNSNRKTPIWCISYHANSN